MAKSEDPIIRFPGGDHDIEQAAAKGRKTFRYFWREMAWERRRIVPGLDLAAVKGDFTDPPQSRSADPDRKRGGILSAFKKGNPAPQDYAKVAQAEHPMSVNMRDSLDEQLTQQPDFLGEADDHGFTLLHQLSLAGSFDGVDVCLKHGARPNSPPVQSYNNGKDGKYPCSSRFGDC